MDIARPAPAEYASYFEQYVARVPDGDLLTQLAEQSDATRALLAPLDDGAARHRYAPGKWSVKEVLGHLVDCERLFVARAVRIARGDATPLPGFDEDALVAGAGFDERPLETLLDDAAAARTSTISFFRSVPPDALARVGRANDRDLSVRANAYVIAGHELHHVEVIRERYLA